MSKSKERFLKRKQRVRSTLKRRAYGKLRLSVYKSDCHIYAQLIDDAKGHTVASASTLEKELAKDLKVTSNIEAAIKIGATIAQRAIGKVNAQELDVIFDRGGYIYHGKIKALADAARQNGLKF